jgi:hypothetical protein
MVRTEAYPSLRLSLWRLPAGQNKKGQNKVCSVLPYSRSSGARGARQRCPILHSSHRIVTPYSPFQRDISTLQLRGHFYFALTAFNLESCLKSPHF